MNENKTIKKEVSFGRRFLVALLVLGLLGSSVPSLAAEEYDYDEDENYDDEDYNDEDYDDEDYNDEDFDDIDDIDDMDLSETLQLLYDTATEEDILANSTQDPEGEDKIEAAMDSYDADDTWAIYFYCCGADLEGGTVDELSLLTEILVSEDRSTYSDFFTTNLTEEATKFVSELDEQDMDLPEYLYTVTGTVSDTDSDDEEEEGEPAVNGFASLNIEQITGCELPENIQIVMQTGGSTAWENPQINPNRSQRFLYDSEGFRMVEDNHIQDMGDPETFADFLAFCQENYPADHQVLICWDHGSGSAGYGCDNIYGGDTLTLKEMQEAFASACDADPDDPPFDIIGFDACLMASSEVAESLYGYGRYLTASEELIPGFGWKYDTWINELIENPEMNAAELAQAITDAYVDYYAALTAIMDETIFSVTFSTVDITAAHEVYGAYKELCAAILQDSIENISLLSTVGRAANQSIKYAQSLADETNAVDLGLMAEELLDDYPEEAQGVLDALDEAVLYHRSTNFLADSNGLTIYFPDTINDVYGLATYLDYIYTICDDPDIQALYYYKFAGCLNDELQEYAAQAGYGTPQQLDTDNLKLVQNKEATITEDANFSFSLTEDELSLIQDMNLILVEREDYGSVNLGEDKRLSVDENGVVSTEFDGTWLAMDGNTLEAEVVNMTDDSIQYRTEVMYNGDASWMMLIQDRATGEISVSGIYTQATEENVGTAIQRNMETLSVGDTIQPIYSIVSESFSIEKGVGEEFQVNEDSSISYEALPDGEYYLLVAMSDVRGDQYDSPVITFTIEDGEMSGVGPSERTPVSVAG